MAALRPECAAAPRVVRVLDRAPDDQRCETKSDAYAFKPDQGHAAFAEIASSTLCARQPPKDDHVRSALYPHPVPSWLRNKALLTVESRRRSLGG